jgi:hypothetical protein
MSEGEPFFNTVINNLGWDLLNSVPHELPESNTEAIDDLVRAVRRGSLAIALGLDEVARAIRDAGGVAE